MKRLSHSVLRQRQIPWFFAFVCLAFGSCQAPPEELSISGWSPIVAVPLVDTQFDLEDVLEMLTDSLDTLPIATLEGGQLAFLYEEEFSGTLAEEWLALPSILESAAIELDLNTALALNLSDDGQVFPLSDTIVTEMRVEAPPGARIDEVILSSGTLNFTLVSSMGDDVEGQLTIPNLLDPSGLPWSTYWNAAVLASGSYTVTEDLSGWRILPDNPNVQDTNVVRALFDVFVINDAGHTAIPGESLEATFGMDGLLFERVEGDFGSSAIYLEEGNSTLALFDDRFTTDNIALGQASIALDITNGFGMVAVLDSVEFNALEDGVVVAELTSTAPPLAVPSAEGSADVPSQVSWSLDETNSNITDFFSVEPRALELSAWIRSNPDGYDPETPNFIDANGFVTGAVRVEIPLTLKVGQLDFVDTLDARINLDLDEEDAALDSAELRLILHNGFPFGVSVELILLDGSGDAVDSLSTDPVPFFSMPVLDAEGHVVEPALCVYDFAMDWERAQSLSAVERAVFRVQAATAAVPDGEYVFLRENQSLRLELAAKLYTRNLE